MMMMMISEPNELLVTLERRFDLRGQQLSFVEEFNLGAIWQFWANTHTQSSPEFCVCKFVFNSRQDHFAAIFILSKWPLEDEAQTLSSGK